MTHSCPTRRSSDLWMTGGQAIETIEDEIHSGGNTDYDSALDAVREEYGTPPDADKTFVYFLSDGEPTQGRSEEHTSELQSLMRISYAVFCLKKQIQTKMKKDNINLTIETQT